MSYSTAGTQKFTMIDNLPDLDDLEGPPPHQRAIMQEGIRGSRYPGSDKGQDGKYAKFIRQSHYPMSAEAGMSTRGLPSMPSPHHGHQLDPHFGNQHLGPPTLEEGYEKPPEKMYAKSDLSCLTVAEHIANCPICSKFYKDDKTIFIIAIIVLAVICILLLKKVLEK